MRMPDIGGAADKILGFSDKAYDNKWIHYLLAGIVIIIIYVLVFK